MVSFGLGPESDYGSLSAFLGVAGASHEKHALKTNLIKAPLLEVANPNVSSTRVTNPKDSTLLNKKVAFRMLKQLGCEVHRLEGEKAGEDMTQYSQCFVEVNLAKQPVLFKMLVELGHGPRRNEDGDLVVRVKEDRHRKPEEVVAALSQPRKPKEVKEVKEEGYPSVGRPRWAK